MKHLSGGELQHLLHEAASSVSVGGRYLHYKGRAYLVTGLCVIEATDTIGVLYQADYAGLEGVTFLRPVEDFLAEVEQNGVKKKRFKKIEK